MSKGGPHDHRHSRPGRRLTQHKTTRYVGGGVNKTQYTLRGHQYDATGRLAKSSYSQYYAGDSPTLSSLEHVYAGANHVQNYDGASAYGAVWHWAGASNSHGASLNSPNPDTTSQKGYNIAAQGGKATPQRRTWLDALTEGDKRELYGQGRPQAKDSSGAGANWYLGTKSDPPASGTAVESRFFFEGTVSGGVGGWTSASLSTATDAREASRIGIFGTSNSYAGSYGRVTNEALGRDLNPLGRGAGYALVAGMLNVGAIIPPLPAAILGGGMQGNSVNNLCSAQGGCSGDSGLLDSPIPGGPPATPVPSPRPTPIPLPGPEPAPKPEPAPRPKCPPGPIPGPSFGGGSGGGAGSDGAPSIGPASADRCSGKCMSGCRRGESLGSSLAYTTCRMAGAELSCPSPREFCKFKETACAYTARACYGGVGVAAGATAFWHGLGEFYKLLVKTKDQKEAIAGLATFIDEFQSYNENPQDPWTSVGRWQLLAFILSLILAVLSAVIGLEWWKVMVAEVLYGLTCCTVQLVMCLRQLYPQHRCQVVNTLERCDSTW